MGVSTHILDITRGRPAASIAVVLERKEGALFSAVAREETDEDGRIKAFSVPLFEAGVYRLTFDVGAYLKAQHGGGFYPEVQISFSVTAPSQHHHVPLLLSPFGYSTYRGS
jgi:5-hydroxyisourate hydrolase